MPTEVTTPDDLAAVARTADEAKSLAADAATKADLKQTADDLGDRIDAITVHEPAPTTLGRSYGIWLDDLAGSSDDAKLDAYLALGTTRRPLLLDARTHSFSKPRTLRHGLTIRGLPGVNLSERGEDGTSPCIVETKGGGTWLTAPAGTTWTPRFTGIAFRGNSSTQFLGGAGLIYRGHLRDCSWSGYRSVLGSPESKLLMTFCVLDGALSFHNSYSTAMHIGGSDNDLFLGTTNIDSGEAYAPATPVPHLWLDWCEKTRLGGFYMTASGRWSGLRISGPTPDSANTSNRGGPVTVAGARIEGRNTSSPCEGQLILVDGGTLRMRDTWVAYSRQSPIKVTGGRLRAHGLTYDRANGVAETVPLIAVTGGDVRVSDVDTERKGGAWTGLPRVSGKVTADGTVTLAS